MLRPVVPLAVILLATGPALAVAQVPGGDVAAGRALVAERCSGCHAEDGKPRADEQAPSLAAVARMPSTTSISLRAFLLTSHPRMPNYRLTEREVDDVVAYVLSLKQR